MIRPGRAPSEPRSGTDVMRTHIQRFTVAVGPRDRSRRGSPRGHLCPLPGLIHDPLVYWPTWFYVVPGRPSLRQSAARGAALVCRGRGPRSWHQPGERHSSALRTPLAQPSSASSHSRYNIFQARWEDDRLLSMIEPQHPTSCSCKRCRPDSSRPTSAP